jgi:serine protease Do
LGALILLLLLPSLAEQMQYAITRGRERAQAEVAREELANLPEGVSRLTLAAKAIAPSVVGVNTSRLLRRRQRGDEWSFFGRPFGVMEGQGSGVIVDKQGYIITNAHVVEGVAEGAAKLAVTLSDGSTVRNVEVVGADPASDIAVLKIEGSDKLVAAPWGDSDKLEVGEQVLAVGSPYALSRTVTAGIISAKERRGLPLPQIAYQDFLQTDAAVNPGNSGGPLVNLKGEVVGINTAIFGDKYQGISFAISSRIAQDVYGRLRAGEKVTRGWLGVRMQRLTDDLAERMGLPEARGALVADVLPDSPAQEAGIEQGDVIVQWDGKPVHDGDDLRFLAAGSKVGSEIKVLLYRNGQKVEVRVKVAERPPMVDR